MLKQQNIDKTLKYNKYEEITLFIDKIVICLHPCYLLCGFIFITNFD